MTSQCLEGFENKQTYKTFGKASYKNNKHLCYVKIVDLFWKTTVNVTIKY